MLRIVMFSLAAIIMVAQSASAFDGLNMNMGTLSLLSDAKTRSISPENFSGQKGSGAWQTRQNMCGMFQMHLTRQKSSARAGKSICKNRRGRNCDNS